MIPRTRRRVLGVGPERPLWVESGRESGRTPSTCHRLPGTSLMGGKRPVAFRFDAVSAILAKCC